MSAKPSVRLVTSADFPDLAVDDRELLVELRSRGVSSEPVIWDDPGVDWADAPLCVLRSVYDYHLRRDEFMKWVDRVSCQSLLFNSAETVRWNSHKSYLRDLALAGFPVIDTEWLSWGETVDIEGVCQARGWTEAVVKPAVSASAYETLQFSASDTRVAQAHAERLLQRGDALLQPYLYEIERVGETAIIWLNGRRTHCVRRPSGLHSTIEEARRGSPLVPTEAEVRLATTIYETIQPEPLYARIDLVDTASVGLLLLELELIEPALYLRHSPSAVSTFADGIVRLLKNGSPS